MKESLILQDYTLKNDLYSFEHESITQNVQLTVEGYGRRYLKNEINAYIKTLTHKEKNQYLLNILSTVFRQYQSVRAIKQNTKLANIVEARNYHSHLLPRKGQPLVSIEELYDLIDELRKVLICCILSYLQFPNIEIDVLTHNSYNELFQEW